ncbi:MAG: tetratricopeptide repeat protein [Porticoccaceae bacterium]
MNQTLRFKMPHPFRSSISGRIAVVAVLLAAIQVAGDRIGLSAGPLWNIAQAAEAKERKYENTKTKKSAAVGQKCGKKLEQVQAELEAERWSQAKSLLNASLSSSCTSSYEKSQVWNFLAYAHYSSDNLNGAISNYKKVLDEPGTDERMKTSVYYSIAQLYFATENYGNAARYLETWMKQSAVVGPDAKVLLAQAYYQLNRKNDALRLVNEGIAEWTNKGKLPKENWWGLQRVLYYDKKDYKSVVRVLKKLIKHYPKFSYWRQLGGMYGELNQDVNQLVANELGYLVGNMSKERELLSMAYLFMGADAPFLAARVVDKGMRDGIINKNAKNLEFLGQAWQQAQDGDKARSALEQAANMSGKGAIWARLAGVYLDIGEDKKAVRASKSALNKGGLKRSDLTYMVLGSAQLNLHCYQDAATAFGKAARSERNASNASRWIEHANREGARRKQLRDMGANIAGCSKA